jgi:hypothetical protein
MLRHEVSAIIGAYSRQGESAVAVPGGFLVDGKYRTMKEARRDTETDPHVLRVIVERRRSVMA